MICAVCKEIILVQFGYLSYNDRQKAGENMVIGIIGAGASGMAAALSASDQEDVQVLIFERQARVGRKLLATGNGRCNLTNISGTQGHYHGEDSTFVQAALREFSVEDTLDWFTELGLYTVAEAGGRVYPYSDQANSVGDVLRFALQRPNVRLYCGTEITAVKFSKEGFILRAAEQEYSCDKLIIACGGLAGTKLGGSMSGYKLLRSLGHSCTRLRPSLVQLQSDWYGCPSLKGVRANCQAQILRNGELYACSRGQLQFTEYGLSGPVIFEISRDVCQSSGTWLCRLDLLPEMDKDALLAALMRRRQTQLPVEELLTGILHNRLGRVLTAAAGVRGEACAQLTDAQLEAVADMVKGLELAVTDTLGMDSAQVTAGGIVTGEFDPNTLESRLVPGVYACGEVLDIDGDCGGYNLQWAWSSGRLAGAHAGGIL